jgi:acetylornithine deacetylase/succinyl-diaminopimelate desuccinylase-like protein
MTSVSWNDDLAAREQEQLEELLEFLRMPSVSTAPEHRDDVVTTGDWVATRLRAAGVPLVEVSDVDGFPIITGWWAAAPGKPTVLIYGHYDVQPPEPLELWESPPFGPTIRDGRIYARGASDMKGNLLATIQAVAALARAHGAPPVNLILLYEGEEEIGSPGLQRYLARERERLACDVAVSADSGMFGPDMPALLVGLKGLAACQIDLRCAAGDLHSGVFGATVPNAARAIAELVAGFHDADGRIAVEGFYDKVIELTAEERAEMARVPITDDMLRAQAGVQTLSGEVGYSPLERMWARPTADVNGIWSGYTGEGLKTVTPCEAHAKITCRLVPDQNPDEILDLIERHVAAHCPLGATATVQRMPGKARPYVVSRDNPAQQVASRVLTELYERDPLVMRMGASVPVVEVFKRELGVETVALGWSLPDSQPHAPNEWYRVRDFHMAARGYAGFLEALGS